MYYNNVYDNDLRTSIYMVSLSDGSNSNTWLSTDATNNQMIISITYINNN